MTPKTEVAKRDNGALAIPEGSAGMSGQFGREDMVMPVASITQPMSQDRGEEGKWWFSDGTALKEITVVVLDIVATRAMWADVGGEIDIICRSNDRMLGETEHPELVFLDALPKDIKAGERTNIPCEDCPRFASAMNYEKGADGLWCPYGYTLLMVPEDDMAAPFLYFVKGSAMRPVKARIVSPALQRYKRTGKAEPWLTPFTLTPRKVEQPGRKYWVPDISALAQNDEEERETYRELALDLAGRASEQTMADDPEPAATKQQTMLPDN